MPRPARSLAIFSGIPAFREKVHVGRPNIPDRAELLHRFGEILDRRWLTNRGPLVEEFEAEIARLTGARHCIATCNGTVALEVAVRACGLEGEVILPSFTFVATAHVLEWLGIRPVFADIDPATHNIDPAEVEKLISARTTGIVGVHIWGRPCEVDALTRIAAEHGLTLLFDAAHAFGSAWRGTMVGNFGRAEVFSFHATKFMNTAEGGAVVTNDDDLAARIRSMSNFGFAGYDDVRLLGTNAKMNEFSAALGLGGLSSMNDWIAINRRQHQQYSQRLGAIDGISVAHYPDGERSNYQYAIVEIDEKKTGITRDDLVAVLWAENVLARRYFYPGCHRMEPYRHKYADAAAHLKRTDELCSRVMALPMGSSVDEDTVNTICDIIEIAVASAAEIAQALKKNS